MQSGCIADGLQVLTLFSLKTVIEVKCSSTGATSSILCHILKISFEVIDKAIGHFNFSQFRTYCHCSCLQFHK